LLSKYQTKDAKTKPLITTNPMENDQVENKDVLSADATLADNT